MVIAKLFPRRLHIVGALVVALLLALSGCSSVRLAYGYLDWWLRAQLNDYLELQGAQKQQLEAAVDEFHRWHRKTQLPVYADYLDQLAAQVDEAVPTRAHLQAVETQVEAFGDAAGDKMIALAMPVLDSLNAAQIDRLSENLREEREESMQKWRKAPHKSVERREKQMRKQAKRWLGELSPGQEQLIEHWAPQLDFDRELRDQQRQLWQATFISILRQKPDGYRERLRSLLLDPQQLWDPAYRQMRDQRRELALQFGDQLVASSTAEQRRHLSAELRRHAEDFRILSRE